MVMFWWLPLLALPLSTSLNNGLARTPPMGWLSWAQFYCNIDCKHKPMSCISERLYMDMADRLVEDGYRDVGYELVNVDDCWMAMDRDKDGKLVADSHRFPHGVKYLADYMHKKGLKLGIYEDFGTKTCAGYPGSLNHLKVDADTFAAMDVDMLKLDGCNVDIKLMAKGYPDMRAALNATGHPMIYSCEWPLYVAQHGIKPDYKAISDNCNLWRNYNDISPNWKSILSIIDFYSSHQDELIPYNGPGSWNDPDMIVVGQPTVSVDQSKAQMSIWSIWSAPLLMSNDLRFIAPAYKEILQNVKVIAVDQDPMGKMGKLVANAGLTTDTETTLIGVAGNLKFLAFLFQNGDYIITTTMCKHETNVGVYVKPMTPVDAKSKKTSYAVAFLNRHDTDKAKVSVVLSKIGLTNPMGYMVEELWTGRQYGTLKPGDTFTETVNPTGVVFIKATVVPSLF